MTYRLYSLATTEYTNYNFALPNTRYCAFIAISAITSLWIYIDVIILFIINLGVCYLYHTFLTMPNTSKSKKWIDLNNIKNLWHKLTFYEHTLMVSVIYE